MKIAFALALLSLLNAAYSKDAPARIGSPLSKLAIAIATDDRESYDAQMSTLARIDEPFNEQQETALTLAAMNHRAALVQDLIQRGANVNHRITTGYSALIFAAMAKGRPLDVAATVKTLLAAGADCTCKNIYGETALDVAMKSEKAEVVDLLRQQNCPAGARP